MLRRAIVPFVLFGPFVLTGCGFLGTGINTVQWPGTHVSHVVQTTQQPQSIAPPAPRQREASVHRTHDGDSQGIARAEVETAPLTEVAGPAFAVTKPSGHPPPGSPEWHQWKVKQELEDAKKDRELANTINAICHGC